MKQQSKVGSEQTAEGVWSVFGGGGRRGSERARGREVESKGTGSWQQSKGGGGGGGQEGEQRAVVMVATWGAEQRATAMASEGGEGGEETKRKD